MFTDKTLLSIRIFFLVICATGGVLVCYTTPQWDGHRLLAFVIGLLGGALVILVDLLLKGFSLRGLSALTFGLAMGSLISWLLRTSPLFERADPDNLFLTRLILFVVCMYLGTVITLRGRNEFNFVVPYVRFTAQDVNVPLAVIDTSALIDGRIVRLCETGFFSSALILPSFVIDEIRRMADAHDPQKRERARRGLDALAALKKIKNIDLRIHTTEATADQRDAKLVFIARSMKARLLTTDSSLARVAEFNGVQWLNLATLAKSVRADLLVGETVEIDLVRPGKEESQAVGYIDDGSMVVVHDGRAYVGKRVTAEIINIMPSAGGKMIFARLKREDAAAHVA